MSETIKQGKQMEDAYIDFLGEISNDELQPIVDKINSMGFNGPTVDEYFESVNFKP